MATIVRYRSGRVDIVPWSGGPSAGADVAYARQNLPLIVNGGRLNPNLSDGPEWGATLGNAVRVWRSGVGIDARGNLIRYAVRFAGEFSDCCADPRGCLPCVMSELLYLGCNNGEALACVAGPGGLDCRVEREHLGLSCDPLDRG